MAIIRRDTDYAVRALLFLCRSGNDCVSCGVLSRECNIPRALTHKLLRAMVDAGIVASRTGRRGGFCLARRPKQISLLSVARATQEGVEVSRCVLCPGTCAHKRGCRLSVQWRRLQREIESFLRGITLADVERTRRPAAAGGGAAGRSACKPGCTYPPRKNKPRQGR